MWLTPALHFQADFPFSHTFQGQQFEESFLMLKPSQPIYNEQDDEDVF